MAGREFLNLFAKLPSICHLKIFSVAVPTFTNVVAIELGQQFRGMNEVDKLMMTMLSRSLKMHGGQRKVEGES